MTIPEEDVDKFLAMIGARFDVEGFEIGRAKKLSINDESANRLVVAVVAEFIENDMVGDEVGILIVEEDRDAGVAVIVTGLSLRRANTAEFKFRIERLIGAGAEQYFWLLSQLLWKQEAQANRWAGAK